VIGNWEVNRKSISETSEWIRPITDTDHLLCYPRAVRLKDTTAIITGAGSGIGRAIAVAFAREGANVALVGRRRDPLTECARECGHNRLIITADLRNPRHIEHIVTETVQRFGALDIVVNNAGALIGGSVDSQKEDDFDEMMDVNVKAVWRLTRAALPHLRARKGGSIINISSVLGLIGMRNRLGYATSKGAVTLMTKAMAMDLAADNIRVNCICPGIVETELVAGFIRQAPDPATARQARESLHAMNRFGQPDEIAGCAVFLASDESKWVTGAAIPVDGGYLAGKA
jgi:NAD(P)-dependent dehydrogenase (short-subunit alcohol dehydrogenase family)